MKNLLLIYFIFHHGVNTSNATIIKRKIGQSYKLTCAKKEHKDVGGCYLQTPKGAIYVLWSGARWENGRILADINHPCKQTEVKNARRDDEGIWEYHQFIQTKPGTIRVVNIIEVIIDPLVVNQYESTSFTDTNTTFSQGMILNSTSKKSKEIFNKTNKFHKFKLVISSASMCTILIIAILCSVFLRRTIYKRNLLAESKLQIKTLTKP